MSTVVGQITDAGTHSRVDITELPASEVPGWALRQCVCDAELYLERKGARTYLVARR
jgi:hypothetical protein